MYIYILYTYMCECACVCVRVCWVRACVRVRLSAAERLKKHATEVSVFSSSYAHTKPAQ